MWKVWVLGGLFFAADLCAMGAPQLPDHFEVHGHRGARAREPENTLPSFRHALEVGADTIELDLTVTGDRHIIVNHDPSVNTNLCVTEDETLSGLEHPLLSGLTLEQVKTYDCGVLFDRRFPERVLRPNTRIPTFREFVQFACDYPADDFRLNIEIKYKEDEQNVLTPHEFVSDVLSILQEEGFPLERTMHQSFSFAILDAYHELAANDLQTAVLVFGRFDVARLYERFDGRISYVAPHEIFLRTRHVRQAHALGLKIVPYTVNKAVRWSRFIRMGVDGIITDDPERLIEFAQIH